VPEVYQDSATQPGAPGPEHCQQGFFSTVTCFESCQCMRGSLLAQFYVCI
jgi:hypothetical protein